MKIDNLIDDEIRPLFQNAHALDMFFVLCYRKPIIYIWSVWLFQAISVTAVRREYPSGATIDIRIYTCYNNFT